MKRFILFVLLLIYGNAFAQTNWLVDSSSVTFEILNAGIAVDGSFDGLNTNIKFNPADLDGSKIIASIESGTVNTGIRIRDKHLRKQDYFDTDSFPIIRLSCEKFQHEKDGRFIGEWTLELKGSNESVSFPFIFTNNAGVATFEGNFSINRLDFDIGRRSPILADEVKVDIKVWAQGVQATD